MSAIKKKIEKLDVTWKIAFRKTLLVGGCILGFDLVCIIILFVLSITLIPLGFLFPLGMIVNETTIRYSVLIFTFFGLFVGLFKALIDISFLTETNLHPS